MSQFLFLANIVGMILGIMILLHEYRIIPKKLAIPGYVPSRLMKVIGFVILIGGLMRLLELLP